MRGLAPRATLQFPTTKTNSSWRAAGGSEMTQILAGTKAIANAS
jgi:hypothetical protein